MAGGRLRGGGGGGVALEERVASPARGGVRVAAAGTGRPRRASAGCVQPAPGLVLPAPAWPLGARLLRWMAVVPGARRLRDVRHQKRQSLGGQETWRRFHFDQRFVGLPIFR